MNNDPFSYLHRTGIMSGGIAKGSDRPKVKTVAMAVKRPPEFPSRTPAGPREGHPAGRVKSTAKEGSSFVNEANTKGRDGDGWGKGDNKPSRVGPETGPSQGFETKGSNKAKAAGKKGVETQSPKVEKKKGLTKSANIEGNESPMYERLEKKSLKSLKGGGTEKELREGHNEKKSMKPGGGGRFAKLKGELEKKGGVKDPGAVAAAIGRKKYGKSKMAKWSAAGRKRSA